VECFPKYVVLPERSVARTRNIAQNFIELKVLIILAFFQVWELGGVVVGYKQRGKIQSFGLVDKHVSSLCICIISNHKATRLNLVGIVGIDAF
jgi:hypothetical protein